MLMMAMVMRMMDDDVLLYLRRTASAPPLRQRRRPTSSLFSAKASRNCGQPFESITSHRSRFSEPRAAIAAFPFWRLLFLSAPAPPRVPLPLIQIATLWMPYGQCSSLAGFW